MKKRRLFLLFAAVQFYILAEAQPTYMGPIPTDMRSLIIITEGDVTSLLEVKKVNIVYDYKNMKVGKYDNEEYYINQRTADYNKKGDTTKSANFRNRWFSLRRKAYEPKFEALFNKAGKRAGISGVNYDTINKVTLVVKLINTDPGFMNSFFSRANYLDLRATFMDKNNTELFRCDLKNVPGFNIDLCYAQAAKVLVKDLIKKLEKVRNAKPENK
jgi:hypothetical protein